MLVHSFESIHERIYLLPHRPPMTRLAILWSARTPRPVPVVFGMCETLADGSIKGWYDKDELMRALQVWASEFGVRLDASAIIREVFGEKSP